MAKTNLVKASQPSAEALQALGDELRPVYESLVPHITKMRSHSVEGIMQRHQIGTILNSEISAKDQDGDALALLSNALIAHGGVEVSRNMLLDYMRIARVFPGAERLEQILSRRTGDGKQLTYSNLVALSGEPNNDKRKALLLQVFKEGSSFAELRAKLQKVSGKGQGRKPKVPKTASAALQQVSNYCVQIENRVPGWNTAIFEKLEQAAPKTLQDAGLIKQLEKASLDLTATRKLLREQQDHIHQLLARVRRISGHKKEVSGEAGEVEQPRRKKKRVVGSPKTSNGHVAAAKKPAAGADVAKKFTPEQRKARLERRAKIQAAKGKKRREPQTA